jgi:hypothetical protein
MKNALPAAVAVLAMAATNSVYAQLPQSSLGYSPSGGSASALHALVVDWERIGFNLPSKPAQYRVYGRDGYVTSGPQYNIMVSLIRSAAADSRAGRDQDALTKIAKVRSLLAH